MNTRPLLPSRRDLAMAFGVAAISGGAAQAQRRPSARRPQASDAPWPYTDFGPAGAVAERTEVKDLNLTLVRFANGVRLTVKPTNFARDHALVRVRVGHGLLDLPRDRLTAVSALGPRVIEGGLETMTSDEITQALAGRMVSASFSIQPGGFVQLGVTSPGDFELQMQVLAAYLAKPGWRSDDVAANIALNSALYRRAASSPDSLYQQQSPLLLHSGDARWREADPQTLAAMIAQDVRAFMAPILARDAIEVVVVGDVSADRAIEVTAATYGALPARQERPVPSGAREVQFPAPTPAPIVLKHNGRADQALIAVAWPTAGWTDPNGGARWKPLQLILRDRLDDQLLSGAFKASQIDGDLVGGDTFPGYGYIWLQVKCPPSEIRAVLAAVDAATDDLASNGPTPAECDQVIRRRIDNWTTNLATNTYWMVALAGAQANPQVLQTHRDVLPKLAAVTPGDLHTEARRYLLKAKAWRMTVVPAPAAG